MSERKVEKIVAVGVVWALSLYGCASFFYFKGVAQGYSDEHYGEHLEFRGTHLEVLPGVNNFLVLPDAPCAAVEEPKAKDSETPHYYIPDDESVGHQPAKQLTVPPAPHALTSNRRSEIAAKAGTGVLSTVDEIPFFLQEKLPKPFISGDLIRSTKVVFYTKVPE
jgi:hypothetical protein